MPLGAKSLPLVAVTRGMGLGAGVSQPLTPFMCREYAWIDAGVWWAWVGQGQQRQESASWVRSLGPTIWAHGVGGLSFCPGLHPGI